MNDQAFPDHSAFACLRELRLNLHARGLARAPRIPVVYRVRGVRR